jgi:hypothetical protein
LTSVRLEVVSFPGSPSPFLFSCINVSYTRKITEGGRAYVRAKNFKKERGSLAGNEAILQQSWLIDCTKSVNGQAVYKLAGKSL